jgi:photosystem II stability/assembly factor-like uncharacterized protein
MRFALAALALAGALAAAATAAYGGHAVRGAPPGFHPETGAVAGKGDVWILGWYRCRASKRSCLALVHSTDAGRHFTRVALPPVSVQGNVPRLEFANARLGYLVAGGRLYVTRHAGNSWHPAGPTRVLNIALAGGNVYAISGGRFERSPMSRNSWRTVPLPARVRFLVSLAARGGRVWLLGSTRHIRAGDVTLRSTDGGKTFAKSHGPCVPELGGMLVPAGGGVVWAVCPTGMMAGLSRSTDGGRTYPGLRSFHDPGGVRLPGLTNGAGIFPSSTRAAVLYAGASGPLLRTVDLGRRWARVRRTGRFEQLYWLSFATSRVGAALFTTRSHPNDASFWRTTDGGATWVSIPIR